MCVLMLRGPQTPGELKQRTERMHAFGDLSGVHDTLERLIARELVARQGRRPGHKEERYAQLLASAEDEPSAHGQAIRPPTPAESYLPDDPSAGSAATIGSGSGPSADPASAGRTAAADGREDLRERVARLEREVAELRAAIRHPVSLAPDHDLPAPDARDRHRHRHRSGDPDRARRRAGVVSVSLRAAARPRLPLHRDRGHARGSARGRGHRGACSFPACCSSRASRRSSSCSASAPP